MKNLLIPLLMTATVAVAEPMVVASSLDATWIIDPDLIHRGDTVLVTTINKIDRHQNFDVAILSIKIDECKKKSGSFELNFSGYGYPEMIDFNIKKPRFVSDMIASSVCKEVLK